MGKDIKPFPTYWEAKACPPGEKMEWEKHRPTEYWEYRRKWVEYPKKMYAGDFPINLDIETTNLCNLRCGFCPRTVLINLGKYGKIGTMDFGLYKSIIDEGAENGLCSIKLNYLGEPLLDKELARRIKYAKDKGVIEVMMNNNGTLLDEENAYKILEAGIDSVFFSVDSINRENYNRLRVGAEYNTVVNNIKNFVRIKNELGYKHVQTRCSMVVMPGNEHEAEEYAKFWLPIVGIVGFCEYVEHVSTHKEYQEYNPDFVCAQPFQRMFVMWDGIVTPCCVDDNRGMVMGDTRKEKVKDIWHGERYRRLRETMINGRYYDNEICKRCYIPWATKGG